MNGKIPACVGVGLQVYLCAVAGVELRADAEQRAGMPEAEAELIEKAKRYLKHTYDEDTVAMTITNNTVARGTGSLAVDCTVSVSGRRSDWSKVFHFANGTIADMDYRRR